MRGDRSLSQFALMLVLATPIASVVIWQKGAAAVQPAVIQNGVVQMMEEQKAEGDQLLQQRNQQYQTSQYAAIIRSWKQTPSYFMAGTHQPSEIQLKSILGRLQEELEDFRARGDRKNEAKTLKEMGINYAQLSRYRDSLSAFKKAVQIYKMLREYSNVSDVASLLRKLGWLCDELGQYELAIESYQLALSSYQEVKDTVNEKWLLNLLAWVYFSIGQYQKSIEMNQQALAIDPSYGQALADIGLAYQKLQQHRKAIELAQKALATGNVSEAFVLNDLGNAYQALGQYFQAIEFHQKALRFADRPDGVHHFWQAIVLKDLGRALHAAGNDQEAIQIYEKSLNITRQKSFRALESQVLSQIASLLSQQKQAELAIVFYKEAVNIIEAIRQDLRKLPREQQESYTQTVAGTYRALADLLLAQGRVLEAQQVLELLKIQELRDFSRDTRAGGETKGSPLTPREAPIPPAFSDKIALGQKLIACESQKPRCGERENLQAQLKTANNTFNQLADRLRTQQATKDPAQLQRDELTLAAQKVVLAQPKTVLIYPLVLEDKLWLVWGTQAGAKGVVFDSKEIPVSRKELSATVVRFRQLLERPGDIQEFQQVSQKLYTWLIAPIRTQLDANGIQNLVFSLDRATRYIPMSALYDGQQYLVEQFNLSTILTAGTTDTRDKLDANPANTKVLGLGLSNAVTGFNPLPNVVDELDGIVRSQPSDRAGIFPGSKFLNQTFDRRAFNNLIDYQILHIATHGKFVPGQPEDSFLVLGNGDPLRIPEIKSMTDLSGIHLVVLSACETAKGGEDKEGLEVSGISYYFITSGAKAVIASLWLVNDASTALMMQRFYQNLPKGISKAAALRQVQLQFIQGKLTAKDAPQRSDIQVTVAPGTRAAQGRSPDFSHPYYWAPFILIGNSL